MQFTLKEVERYLSQMAAYMKETYKNGNREESLEIFQFLLELLVKIAKNTIPSLNTFIPVSILDFFNIAIKQKDFFTFDKALELVDNLSKKNNTDLVRLLFYPSISFKEEREIDNEKKRILILSEFSENILTLDYKSFNKVFYFLLRYTYENGKFVKEYLIPLLLDFYRKNRNSLNEEELKEFLRKTLVDILWTLPKQKKKAEKLKQELILELGKESILNLWLEDFKFILEYIKFYSSLLSPNGEETFNKMLVIWGIYIFYLLNEDESLFPQEKKLELIKKLSRLKINIGYNLEKQFNEILSEAMHYYIVSLSKKKPIEEVIKEFLNSTLEKWELMPEIGGKRLKIKRITEYFFLFSLLEGIFLYFGFQLIIEHIFEKIKDNFLIYKIISMIDLNNSLRIYKDFHIELRNYLKLFNRHLEIPKMSSFYFTSEKVVKKFKEIEFFKKWLKNLLKLSLKRYMELKLEEYLKTLSSSEIETKLEEWKQMCEKVKESCKEERKSFADIYYMYLSTLGRVGKDVIIVDFPTKAKCIQLNICSLSTKQCKYLFLDKIGNIQLPNRNETIKELYQPLFEEIFTELITQNSEFKEKFNKWCEKEKLLIFHFFKEPKILFFQIVAATNLYVNHENKI